jgi:hypothetical protein
MCPRLPRSVNSQPLHPVFAQNVSAAFLRPGEVSTFDPIGRKGLVEKPMHLLVLGLAFAAACAAQSSAGASSRQATAPAPSPPSSAPPATPASQAPSTAGAENPDSRSEGTAADTAGGEEAALESQIQKALEKDPTLVHSSVRVAVSREAIELTGSVATSRERLTATRIAQSYAGSKRVVSRITVSASPQESGTPEKRNAAGSQRQLRR